MREVRHRSRNHAMRGDQIVSAPIDVSGLPEWQPTLLRLGSAVGDVNAASIDRITYVKQVAGAIAARMAAQ